MDRVKIQEIASEAGASNAVLIEKAKELGYDVKAGNSTLTIEEAGILVNYAINGVKPKKEEKPKIKKKIVVRKHAGIVSTPKKAKVSATANIKEVKIEEKPKIERVKSEIAIKPKKIETTKKETRKKVENSNIKKETNAKKEKVIVPKEVKKRLQKKRL